MKEGQSDNCSSHSHPFHDNWEKVVEEHMVEIESGEWRVESGEWRVVVSGRWLMVVERKKRRGRRGEEEEERKKRRGRRRGENTYVDMWYGARMSNKLKRRSTVTAAERWLIS